MRARALAMPRVSLAQLLRWGEFVLVVALGLAAARLFWLMVTPLGPVGQWQPPQPLVPEAAMRSALIDRFDPFGPQAETDQVQSAMTTDLVLHGVRISGPQGGGAILELPDGTQASFAIGDEVLPGLRLVEVGVAHVEVERSGARQRLAMEGADTMTPATATIDAPADRLLKAMPFSPRIEDGAITGISVAATDPSLVTSIGLRPGDVIVSIGNRPVSDSDDLAQLQRLFRPGARITLGVERGAEVIPVVASL